MQLETSFNSIQTFLHGRNGAVVRNFRVHEAGDVGLDPTNICLEFVHPAVHCCQLGLDGLEMLKQELVSDVVSHVPVLGGDRTTELVFDYRGYEISVRHIPPLAVPDDAVILGRVAWTARALV